MSYRLDQVQCKDINSIEEFHKLVYPYQDTFSDDQNSDSNLVACTQSKGFNELKDKYDRHYKDKISEAEFIQGACVWCKTKKEGENWDDFYDGMNDVIAK